MIKLLMKDTMIQRYRKSVAQRRQQATKLYQIIRQHKEIFDTCYFKIYNI